MQSNAVPETVRREAVILQCPICHARSAASVWHPGVKCSECGSIPVYPVLSFRNVEALVSADKSWDSIEQAAFLMLAHWMGFIGPSHLTKFLAMQRTALHGTPDDLSPQALLVKAGILSRLQAEAIGACVKPFVKLRDDMDLLTMAAKHDLVNKDQIENLLDTVASFKAQSLPVPPMCILLLARGIVEDETMHRLLLQQKRHKEGLLAAVEREYELLSEWSTSTAPRRHNSLMAGHFIN